MLSFNQLFNSFSTIFVDSNKYELETIPLKEENLVKLRFKLLEEFKERYPFVGYFIIDISDYAIKEVYKSIIPKLKVKYNKVLFGFIKFRQAEFEMLIKFNKNEKQDCTM